MAKKRLVHKNSKVITVSDHRTFKYATNLNLAPFGGTFWLIGVLINETFKDSKKENFDIKPK